MLEQLISKKELLNVMEISYGQLYRWKRKKLIPEEWFIKKSVSTGQETYFPREKIIDRIKLILDLKEDLSLDDLAIKFSGNSKEIKLNREYIISKNIISSFIIEKFEELLQLKDYYDEATLFSLFIYKELMESGLLSLEEINNITTSSLKDYEELKKEESTLVVKRKLGVCFYFIIFNGREFFKDEASIEVLRISINDIINRINEFK